MTIFEAVFLGIVQGVAEFLPISSSGHLVLVQNFFALRESNLFFDVWLHFSTLLAVMIYFAKDLLKLKKKELLIIAVSSIPAGLVGVLFADTIEMWFSSIKIVSISLLLTGVLNLIAGARLRQQTLVKKTAGVEVEAVELGFKQGFIIGLLQALAIIPGVSRSGSTVFAGVNQGIERNKVFKFSFLLSLPAILGASLLQLIKVSHQDIGGEISFIYLLAAGAAFFTGLLSLGLLEYVIGQAKLNWFGWYCLGLGAIAFFFF